MDNTYYLIIDTCVWLKLFDFSEEFRDRVEIIDALISLVDKNKVIIIASEIVIAEWERNKEKIIRGRINRFHSLKRQLERLSKQLSSEDSKKVEDFLSEYSNFDTSVQGKIQSDFERINNVFLHNSTIKIPITDNIKLQAAQMALDKKAPFRYKTPWQIR